MILNGTGNVEAVHKRYMFFFFLMKHVIRNLVPRLHDWNYQHRIEKEKKEIYSMLDLGQCNPAVDLVD